MALAAMPRDREPEVARFIDTYKYDQDMNVKRDRFGGGTSLPLNSDGYEDKQKVLRDERHKDWLVQQDKPRVLRNAYYEEPTDRVYYRVGTPEQGFPAGFGEYEKQRRENNLIRQKDYNDMIKKQRQTEQQKMEARRHAPPPRPAQPPGPQMDYNLAGEQARAEERRAYQDYMKAKEERYWAMRGRPVTPPGGLNIGNYDRQVKEQAQAKKQEYKKMLDEQQKEHMFLRARQEPEMAVLDRHGQPSQYLADKPPAGPSYGRGRDEALKTESYSRPIPERPTYGQPPYPGVNLNQNDERFNPDAPAKFQPKSPEKPVDREFLKIPMRDDERPQELGTPLAFKTNSYSRQPPPAPEKDYSRQPPPAPEQGYSHQPPPSPKKGYSRQPPPAPEQGYSRQPQPQSRDQGYRAPPFSSDGQKPYRKYENGPEGLFGRSDQSRERPRSRRSLDADRKYSPTKRENVAMPVNQISPRRMKNALYTDSEEVSTKRREASKERQKEYNDLLRMKAEKKRHEDEMFRQQQQQSKPAEVVKNPFYSSDDYEKFQKELQRKQGEEYREFLSQKKNEVQNRSWNFDQNGVLELHGDDAVQSRQRELRAERKQDYNAYISQIKAPARRTWPEPEGLGALLVRKGEYDNIRQMHDEERKRDYIDRMQKRRELGLDMTPPSVPAEPLRARYEYFNPMVNVLGRYDDFRKKLADDRKRDFRTFMDQVKEDDSHRRHYVSTAPTIAREETPIVYSMGTYETETKNKIREERKKDLEEFVHEKQKHWTPRTTVKENLMPHVASAETPLVNYMGSYDNDRLKYRLERNKELRDFSQKKKQELRNPYDNYVYPTVAVAEKPIVDFLGTEVEKRKQHLRAERRQDYEQYTKQQKVTNPGRRHDFVDSTNGPYDGLFHGLGEHGNRSDDLNRERQKDYNDRLEQRDEKYAGKDRPSGRPKWVQESLPNDTDRGRSPMKTQPPVDQYQQMLNEKRREEANLRRFEDPEYQERLSRGRDRGEAGQRYGY